MKEGRDPAATSIEHCGMRAVQILRTPSWNLVEFPKMSHIVHRSCVRSVPCLPFVLLSQVEILYARVKKRPPQNPGSGVGCMVRHRPLPGAGGEMRWKGDLGAVPLQVYGHGMRPKVYGHGKPAARALNQPAPRNCRTKLGAHEFAPHLGLLLLDRLRSLPEACVGEITLKQDCCCACKPTTLSHAQRKKKGTLRRPKRLTWCSCFCETSHLAFPPDSWRKTKRAKTQINSKPFLNQA